MPTYEYECDDCQHKFEEWQMMSAEPLKDCPQCGKPALRRLFGTGGGFIFKGSGFYITDYRSDSYKQSAKADSGASSSAGKSDSAPSGGSTSPSSGATSSSGGSSSPTTKSG